VQLLDPAILAVFATVLIFCAGLALATTLIVRYAGLSRKSFALLFLSILTFALLGFVTGEIMGQSRESAVGAVLPAVLTLLGGIVIYLIGSKGIQTQAVVSSMAFCFALALLGGTLYGARLRVEFDAKTVDPRNLWPRDLALEQNRYALEAVRLQDYVSLLKLKHDFANKTQLDLSHFGSTFETKPPEKTQPSEK
jgi:hypothetical protein